MASPLDEILKRQANSPLDDILKRHPDPPADEGLGTIGWNAFTSGAAGVGAGIASILHADDTANYLQGIVNSGQRRREYDSVLDPNYWTDPYGAYYDIINGLGSMAALAPTAVIPGGAVGAGAARAGTALLGRLGSSALANEAKKQAIQAGLKTFGRGATTGGFESLAEGGNVRQEAIAQGLDNPDERAWKTAAANFPTLALSNGLEYLLLGGKMFNPAGKAGESVARRAAMAIPRTAPVVGANAAQNAGEELLQQTYSDYFMDKPVGNVLNPSEWTEDQWKALQAGGVVGGVLGGAGGAYHSMGVRPEDMPPQTEEETEPNYNTTPKKNVPTGGGYIATWDNDGIDSRFITKWESAPGATDFSGLQDSVKSAINGLAAEYGGFTVTGAAEKNTPEKKYHEGGEEGHEGGWKIDVDKASIQDEERFLDLCRKYGFAVGDEGSHYDLSLNPKGSVGGEVKVAHGQQPSGQREGHENAWAIYDVFKAAGYSDNAIAGILGRVQQEHNFDTSDVPEHEEEGMHLGGYGMFQWNGGRTTAFLNWAQENGLDPQDATTQAQYALLEAQQRGLTPEKMNQLSHEEAADLWTSDWEVGKPGDERKCAGEWLARLQNGGGVAGGTTPSTNNTKVPQAPKVDTYDDVYEQFAKEQSQSSDEETKDFFSGMFTKNDKFIDNEENRRKIDERYGEELKEFADVYRNPSVQTQIDRLIDKAVEAKDYNSVGKLQAARRSGDIQLMQKYLDEAREQEAPQIQGQTVPQVIPQQAPAQNVPQAKPAFPIVQEPAQDAPQPAQQTEQAQPIQVPTQQETAQQEPVVPAQMEPTEIPKGEIEDGNTQSTQSTQTQPTESINTANQNQNAEPGQGNAAEGQQEVTQPGKFVTRDIPPKKGDYHGEYIAEIPMSEETFGKFSHLKTEAKDQWGTYEREIGEYKDGKGVFTFPSKEMRDNFVKDAEEKLSRTEETGGHNVNVNGNRLFVSAVDGKVTGDKRATYRAKEVLKSYGGKWNKDEKAWYLPDPEQRRQLINNFFGRYQWDSPNAETAPAQEKPKKESMALSKFRENVAEVVEKYRNDETTYEKAFQKIADMQVSAEHVAPDDATVQEIRQVAEDGINQLNAIYAEKQGTPSQTAQEGAGEQETTAQVEEPTQEEKPAQSEAEPNEGGEKSAQNATVEENSTVDENGNPKQTKQESVPKDSKRSESVEKYIEERHPDHAAEIRKDLYDEMETWDEETQSHKKITYAQFLENFAKTPGARVYYKPPQYIEGVASVGDMGAYVYQNDKMKANGYEPTLRPVGYDYLKYLLSQKSKAEPTSKDTQTEQTKQEPAQPKNKLQRIRNAKEEMQAVAKKYADGEISQSEAYRHVAVIAKEKATRAKDGLPNVTFIDNKIKQELNDYGDRLIDEATQESSGAYTKVIPPQKKNDPFRVEVDITKLKEYDNSRFNVRMLAKKHALTKGKLAKDTYAFKFDNFEAAKAYADEIESYIAKYLQKDAEPKQEKPAERRNGYIQRLDKALDEAVEKQDVKIMQQEIQNVADDIEKIYAEDIKKIAHLNDPEITPDKLATDAWNELHELSNRMNHRNGMSADMRRDITSTFRAEEQRLESILDDLINSLEKQEKHAEAENNTVKEPAKEEGNNEQQGESGSPDGGHEGVRTRESGADQREEAGGVSEHDGRKGKGHGSDNVEGHSEEPQSAGVRAGAELDSAASTGTDKRGNQPDVPLTEAQAHPSPTETPGHNYEIKENEGDPNKRNADVRYKQNIDAIKLLRQLEDEERMATPAEQKILAQYNGWGGLTSKFKEGSETDKELRSLLSAEEYRDAQRSSLSAYYTPPKIVKAIWAGLSHLGFKGGRVLDPAMGVGNFFGCMPRGMMAKSVLDGVEMESLTARLARQLYPDADVQNTAFQRSNTPKNFYDLVITNVPFEQTVVNGYQVHNYYFAAGIDKVRPGGLMVYITGQGSLSGGSDAARMRTYLNKEADLIGAFKLPSGVFDATNVGTDVVVFQKHIDGKKSPNGQDFTEVEQKGTYGNFYGVNQYFTQHRENVLGEMSVGKNRFGDTELNVKSRGTVEDVAGELEAAMKKLPKNVYEPVSRNNSKPFNPSETAKRAKADEKTRDREYYYKDGKIVQNQDGKETEIKGKQAEVVKSYVKLKNSLNALLAAETDPKATDKQVESLRDMLNRDYNDFVKKHGYLHGANKRHFVDDPSSGMVQSLETPIETEEKTKSGATKKKVTGAKKSSIFSERSTNPKKEVTHIDTTSDALVASLNNKGGLDLEYMAKLTGKTQEKLLSELKGTVFKDPATENFVTKDEYLSGNVREKLILAKEMAKRDKSYAANVKALEEVQPEDLVPEEIFVSLGTPWIPAQDVNNFVHTIANGKFTVHYNNALAKWTVTGWLNSTKFGTRHIAFEDFLTKVLNGQVIEIKYTDEDKKAHIDEAATKAVTAEAERLQAEFKEWIWKDKERAKRLTDYYNANFNNYVLREYDGSHLDPHEHGMNAKIALKPHQKDAVWRILQSGNTLLAHCVGAGKTFEMQTAGMEMRRLGMANKPMYLVPLNVVDQFAKDFRRLYPGAKLLVLTNDDLPQVKLTKKVTKTDDGRIEITDLTKNMSAKEKERIAKNKAKRARILARVRTEDWDGIIMSHTLFKELPVSPETQAAYMEEEFKRLEAALKEAKQTDSLDGTAKRTLEEQKAKLKEKMEEARSVDVKDLGITFEQLGIDQLFVDEADLFKNLHFTSSKTSSNNKIKGITNPQADYKHRAFDMFLKTQWLSKMLNGRGVVFATGTPISNSMAELYTMMRYLDPQGLKEHGTELFDSWIGVFGDIGQDTQLNSTGTNWETVTKVRSYNNRPELLKMFRKFADIKQPSDLPDIKRPDLKGGKPTIIELPVDPAVSRYLKERVPKRIEAMSGGFKKQKGEDNMLALMNDLRNLSLSDSKIEACADTIVSEYKDSTPVKGTQLVFCDLGIPKAASEKEDANDDGPSKKVSEIANPDVYRKLIEKLVKKGIPREQIAFIQDHPKEKRQAVFEKVNNGEIRILIGSTTAMGAGTNCQKHLVALHDLDAPWRPRDLEQRHGRILRQGNENSEVSIYQYALKGSFDAVIWSKLKEKALLIELAMSGDMNSRSMEEADIITLEYSEMVGASLDDPLMKEKVDTENELSKVKNAQTEFSKKVQRAASTLETIDDKIETHQKAVEHIKKDIAGRKSTRGDNFSMTVGNKTFTKRDDAGNAMEAKLKDFDESKPTVVGSLGGFALKAVKTITGIEMEVVGKHSYPVKTISVQGLENTVNVQVDDALEKEEAYLEYLNQQKKDALDIHGQENPYAEKVKTLEEKLADLNRQIKERAVEESKKQNDTEAEEAQEEKPSSNRKYSIDGKPIVGVRKYSAAWHGSPHKFDTFTLDAIGTGEGAQVHGYGLYFAGERKVSEGYRERLAENQPLTITIDETKYELDDFKGWSKDDKEIEDEELVTPEGLVLSAFLRTENEADALEYLDGIHGDNVAARRHGYSDDDKFDSDVDEAIELIKEGRASVESNGALFQVEIPDEDVMLDEQKKFDEQPKKVQEALRKLISESETAKKHPAFAEQIYESNGKKIYGIVSGLAEGDAPRGVNLNNIRKLGSELLNKYGIKGITYEGGRDGRCYVVFDDEAIEIIQRLSVAKGKASKRSMDELKDEVKEAFPGAKVEDQGDTLKLTMPNGQKVTVALHGNITVNEQEEAVAKASHGFDQSASVTIEGYAETVGAEGFIALSQASREGTGFHEAYHIAEAMAFTKKELADAKRLISANEEERADAYAKWKLERKKYSNFAKLWQKIADVAAKLAGILGYETKRNIFRKVESGKIYRRDNTARDVTRQYSVNASDNSTSSYKQRVKNFFMGKQDAPSHRRMLKNMMEEIADIKISYGKLDEGMEAIYKDAQKVIRVRNANDWEKVVPLFAKAVCDKIGIKADKALTHYISDWIQTGAPNNNSTEADTFAKAMREHPEIADQLLDLQSAFMKWNQMDAMERMQSIVSRRETEKTSLSSMLDYAYDQIVEELGPVKRLVKQIEGKIGKQENALNPYVAFRLFRGHHGRAMTMLEGSGADMKAVLARHYPNLNWDGFKTLHEILDSIGGLHDEKIRDEFGNYALACHVYDIHLQNDQIEMQIDMLKKQLASTTDTEKKKELQEKIDRLDRSIMMTPISRTDCGKIIREYGKKYGQAQQDLVHFSNMTLAILKDSGVISETRYARILRKWPNYVPMFRVFDENEKKNFGDSLKALEGSTRDVIDPLESIIRNTFDFVKKAEKNKAKCLLARLAQVSDVGKYIEAVDNNKPNDDTVITYYVDGQKRYLQTDPSVVAAVNGMGIDQSNLLMKILRFPSRLARSAFTVTNPAFLIRNSTRDMQDAFIYNDRGTITPMDFVRAFMHAFRKDDIYWEWMSSGAAQASAISIDRDYAQATLDKMTKTWKQVFKDNPVTFPFKAFLDATERLAEFSELGTRIAAYERTKKALAKDGAALTNMDLAEAAYESRDLMDFARGGKASRQWNSLAIFANASIQGWDKFFRTFNVRKDPKAAMRAMARLAIGGMLPALLLTLANWDEDWWKEIPDWQKDSHWILAPNVRIPKGQDIGLRFVSSMIEKGLDAMHNNNPLTAKRALKPIYDQTPDILPTAMLPIIEAMTNYSFFKEAPIVPQYQKDLPAKLQYSGTTSGLAKALGDLLNYSPRKIDHLIQGYTGSVGKGATSAVDIARGEKRMNTAVEEMPVFSGFMMTPYKNSATVEKFYQEFRKQTEGDKAFKATHERMEGYSPAKYKRMSQANKKMSELNKKERKLLDDNRISPERKQELQAGIQRQRIAIAKGAMR